MERERVATTTKIRKVEREREKRKPARATSTGKKQNTIPRRPQRTKIQGFGGRDSLKHSKGGGNPDGKAADGPKKR